MSFTHEAYVQLSQKLDALAWRLTEALTAAWRTLETSARGEGLGGTAAPAEPAPAVILMAGGLTTLAAVLSLLSMRTKMGSNQGPSGTAGSGRAARSSVDVYLDGSESLDTTQAESSSSDKSQSPMSQRDEASPGDASEAGHTNRTGGGRLIPTSTDPGESLNGSPRTTERAEDPQTPEAFVETVEPVPMMEPLEDERSTSQGTPFEGSAQQAFERGRSAGERLQASDHEAVLAKVDGIGLGTPEIAYRTPNLYKVRLDGCSGCRSNLEASEAAHGKAGCPFEAGFLEGAMSGFTPGGVVVREVACTHWGDKGCVFEIWY